MLTVACVYVRGNVPYTPEYVVKLQAMVARSFRRPFRFVCLTDQPWTLPAEIETSPVPPVGRLPGWWAKVNLFAPNRFTDGRVLYLDLDTLIVNPLDPIVDFPAAFALVPHAGTFEGRNGLAVVKRFNSSVMVWDAGCTARLFTNWTPDVARRLWGDQDWIGQEFPGAATMPVAWFPRISEIHTDLVPHDAKVVLMKKPKNHEAAKRMPWVREAWA